MPEPLRRLCDLGDAWVASIAEGACPSGKRRFAGRLDALAAMQLTNLRWPNPARPASNGVYRCTRCRGGWHMTRRLYQTTKETQA